MSPDYVERRSIQVMLHSFYTFSEWHFRPCSAVLVSALPVEPIKNAGN